MDGLFGLLGGPYRGWPGPELRGEANSDGKGATWHTHGNGPQGLLTVTLDLDFTKNGREYGLVGRGAVLLPDGAEHTLATGLSHQLVQDAVVNFLAASQLVVCGLRDPRHAGMSSRLNQDHERCVPEVHARESMTVPGEGRDYAYLTHGQVLVVAAEAGRGRQLIP